MASVLPLELAAEYYDASTLATLSQTTKECAASKMLEAQWGGVFTRRFPCLAAQPAFQAPLADARGVVRSLLAAPPPLLAGVSSLPPAPRDAEGRVLPLREDVVIAAQLVVRGDTALSHRPLVKGALRFQDVEDLSGNSDGEFWNGVEGPNWLLGIPLETVAPTWDEHREVMRQTLQLPDQIELDLENGTTVPGDLPALVEATCRLVDERLRQEIYVVAGDQVWRLNAFQAAIGSLDQSVGMLEGNFDDPFEEVCNNGGSFIDVYPFVPLQCNFERINCAMATTWMMGCYDGEYEEGHSPSDPLVYTTDPLGFTKATELELYAQWQSCIVDGIVASTGTDDDDDGLSYFRQLLASTRPVRIARAVRA